MTMDFTIHNHTDTTYYETRSALCITYARRPNSPSFLKGMPKRRGSNIDIRTKGHYVHNIKKNRVVVYQLKKTDMENYNINSIKKSPLAPLKGGV